MSDPTEKSIHLSIDRSELAAMVKFHHSQGKRIANYFGKLCLRGSTKVSVREMIQIKAACESKIHYHQARARGLLALYKELEGK
jgi:hypothetical protein